jgi:hypothetical protein
MTNFSSGFCLQPTSSDQPWHSLEDAYSTELKSIVPDPGVHVCEIGRYRKKQERYDVGEEVFMRYPPKSPQPSDQSSESGTETSDDNTSEDDVSTSSDPESKDQRSEVRRDDVVVIDGCLAATVHWDRFLRATSLKPGTFVSSVTVISFLDVFGGLCVCLVCMWPFLIGDVGLSEVAYVAFWIATFVVVPLSYLFRFVHYRRH